MQEPAPKGIIQFTSQHDKDLQEGVTKGLTEAGHPVTVSDVRPVEDSRFENARDILGKTVGHAAHLVSGEEGHLIHVETAQGSKVVSFIRERIKRQKVA